ncbi:hypothetical protein D9M72_497600 [compost metagenome]
MHLIFKIGFFQSGTVTAESGKARPEVCNFVDGTEYGFNSLFLEFGIFVVAQQIAFQIRNGTFDRVVIKCHDSEALEYPAFWRKFFFPQVEVVIIIDQLIDVFLRKCH